MRRFLLFWVCLSACSAPPRFSDWELPKSINYQIQSDFIEIFSHQAPQRKTGLVFYPGGLVHPSAYIPLLATIAAQGYPIWIARMPFDLAVLGADKALTLQTQETQIQNWVLAGHSLGGAMAIRTLKQHPEKFQGLVLLGTYGDPAAALNTWEGQCLSLSGSEDGLSTPAEIQSGSVYLPATCTQIEIQGANHAQFGHYGRQDKDQEAQISREAQHQRVQQEILNLLSTQK